MKKESIEKGFLTGTLLALFIVLRVALEYVFDFEFLYSNWTSLVIYLIQIGTPIMLGYTLFKFLRISPFSHRFLYGVSNFLAVAIVSGIFNLFLHEVLDKDYKYVYAEKLVKRTKEALEKFEKKYNLEVENKNDTESVREEIANRFTLKNQLIGFVKGLPFVVVLGAAVGFVIFRSDKERYHFGSVNP